MVTTVTPSTIAAIVAALPASLVLVLVLFGLLALKELVSASDAPRARALSRTLNLTVYPLLVTFVLILVLHVVLFPSPS